MKGIMNGLMIMGIFYALLYLSACSAATSAGDHITLTGTPAGMQAFADMTNGLIRTGKESAEQPSEYMAYRKQENAEITKREATGFWQKIAGN